MKKFEINPLEGNIIGKMILFSIPLVAISLLQMLFSTMDTVVISRFGSSNAVAAIGTTGTISNLILHLFISLSIGFSVVCGTAYGKKDNERIHQVVNSIPLTSLLLGLILMVIFIPLVRPLLRITNCPDSLLNLSTLYLSIYFCIAPFSIAFNFLTAVLQSKGNTTIPMIAEFIAGILNTILNLIFVLLFHLDVAGVAIATVLSQAASTFYMIFYFSRQQDELKLEISKQKAFAGLSEIWKLGIPSSIESLFLNIASVVIQSAINIFDTNVISGSTLSASIEGLMAVSFVGFMSAGVVFVSQNYGAGNMKRVKQSFIDLALLVFLLGEFLGITVYHFGGTILGLYTTNETYIHYALIRMKYVGFFEGFVGLINCLSGCIRGLGNAKTPTVISFCCSVIFRISWIYFVAIPSKSVDLVFLTYPICWVLMSFSYIIAFAIIYHKKNKKLQEAIA